MGKYNDEGSILYIIFKINTPFIYHLKFQKWIFLKELMKRKEHEFIYNY